MPRCDLKTNITGITQALTRSRYYARHLTFAPAAHIAEHRQLRCNWLGCGIICAHARLVESSFKLFALSNWSDITRRLKFLKPILISRPTDETSKVSARPVRFISTNRHRDYADEKQSSSA